jgi:pimeloyl-ACP methyl ester carboxylesterase
MSILEEHPSDILLVMVPGMGIQTADFRTYGLTGAVEQRGWSIAIATVDLGPDAYLDGSAETRLLDAIAEEQRATGANRIWLAGISLGCQAILRCVRLRPELADGLILLTPYLASTGLIAELERADGLHNWSPLNANRDDPERALLSWLAATPLEALPRIFVGRALNDRFAATATMLAELLPADQVTSVPGEHDWASWRKLWRLIMDENPFGRQATVAT